MRQAEIEALRAPRWKRAILLAMARYGMFVLTTGADPWNIALESGSSYTSFGRPDPWVEFFRKAGLTPGADGLYHLNLAEGVDWSRRLRVIHPCVSEGSCR